MRMPSGLPPLGLMGVLVVTVRGARWDASGTAKVTEGKSPADRTRVIKDLMDEDMKPL